MHIQRLWERFCKPNIIKVMNFEKKLLLTSYPQVFCPYIELNDVDNINIYL